MLKSVKYVIRGEIKEDINFLLERSYQSSVFQCTGGVYAKVFEDAGKAELFLFDYFGREGFDYFGNRNRRLVVNDITFI